MNLEIISKRTEYAISTFIESWLTGAKEFFPLLGAWFVTLVIPVILLVVGVVSGLAIDAMNGFNQGGLFTLIGLIVPGLMIGWMWTGWMYVCLKIARGIPVKVTDVFRPLPEALSGIVALSITSFLIALGSILIIPGALLFMRWQLVPFYIVDRKYGPFKAMQQSWEDTRRMFFTVGLMDLGFFGVSLVVSPSIFGPLVMHMGWSMASALIYHKWLTDEEHPDYPRIESDDHKIESK